MCKSNAQEAFISPRSCSVAFGVSTLIVGRSRHTCAAVMSVSTVSKPVSFNRPPTLPSPPLVRPRSLPVGGAGHAWMCTVEVVAAAADRCGCVVHEYDRFGAVVAVRSAVHRYRLARRSLRRVVPVIFREHLLQRR